MSNKVKKEVDYAQNALFREVAEDVEKEQLKQFFSHYGKRICAIIAVVFLLVLSYEGFKWYRNNTISKDAASYIKALNMSLYRAETSLEELKKIVDKDASGYALLSRFQIASLQLNEGKNEEAYEEMKALAYDVSIPEPFRHLATMILGYYLLDVDGSYQEVMNLVSPLNIADSVWRGSAREILAINEYRAGNVAKAMELLKANEKDAELPESFATRAKEMLSVIKL